MTTSVDTRVVEMRFDNASFQRGVAETLSTLEKLSDKLDAGTTYSGLDRLKAAIHGLSFDSIGFGLDGLLSKASSVFGGLTGMIGTFTKGLLGVSGIASVLMAGGGILQAITGGSQRATNIENARFQLQGLHADWEAISEDINYAVLDTAYGFDAAAMAAAQFTASGVEAGVAMKTALRGISGVAAMTNSSYEDISRIFTTVAGNGRLMGDQLLQLSSRGLNVAAVLGQQLHVSEEEVRDMVSKGMISFDMFASAMDEAFGTHAKEANSTFTGAVSNMKAALNKIGADFIAPLHEFERQGALGLKAIFDAIRRGLNLEMEIDHLTQYAGTLNREFVGTWSIVKTFTHNAERLGARIQKAFTGFAESGVIEKAVSSWYWLFDTWVDGTGDIVGNFVESVFSKLSNLDLTSMSKALQDIGEHAYLFETQFAETVPTLVDIFGNLLGALLNVAGAIASFVQPIFTAFGDVIARFMDIGAYGTNRFLDNLLIWSQRLQDFTANLGLSSDQMEQVRAIFGGVFSGIGSIINSFTRLLGNIGSSVFKVFGALWPVISSLANVIGSVLGPVLTIAIEALSSFATVLGDFIARIPAFVEKIVPIEEISAFFDGLSRSISESFESLDASGVLDFFESLKNMVSSIDVNTDFLKGAGDAITVLFSAFSNMPAGLPKAEFVLISLDKAFKGLAETDQELGNKKMKGIVSAISGANDSVKGIADTFLETINSLTAGISDFVAGFSYEDLIAAISAAVSGLMVGTGVRLIHNVNALIKALADGIGGVSGILESVGGLLDGVTESLTKFAKSLNKQATADVIKSIGISIALLAGSLFLISLIDVDKLDASMQVFLIITALLAGLAAGAAALSKWMTKDLSDKQIAALAANLTSFAVAIGIIAGAVAVLAVSVGLLSLVAKHVGEVELWSAVAAIVVLVGAMAGLAAVIGHIKAGYKSMLSLAAVMLSLGIAIMPLVGAVVVLSMLPWQQVLTGIGELALMLWAVEEMASTLGENLIKGGGSGVAAFAAVMLSLGIAIIPLIGAVKVLSTLPFKDLVKGVGAVVAILVGLGASLALVGHFITPKIGTSLLGLAVALTGFAVAMLALSAAVSMIYDIPVENLENAVGSIVAIMAMLGLISLLTVGIGDAGKIMALSASLLAFGAAVIAVAFSVGLLAAIPLDNLTQGVIALCVILGAFVVIGVLMGTVFPEAAVALDAFAAAVLGAGIGVALIGVGLTLFAVGLGTLAIVAPAAAVAIGTAMVTMAEMTVKALQTFAQSMVNAEPDLKKGAAAMMRTITYAVKEASPEFGEAGVAAVVSFAYGLGQAGGAIASSGLVLVTSLVLGIASGVGMVVDAAVKLILAFMIGVSDAIRENVDMFEDALYTMWMSGLAVSATLLADFIDFIGLGFTGIPDKLREGAGDWAAAAEEASSAAHAKIDESLAAISSDVDKTAGGIPGIISGNQGAVEKASGDLFSAIPEEYRDMIPDLENMADSGMGSFLSTVSGYSGEAHDVGEEVGGSEIDGIVSGMDSKSGEVKSKSQEIVDNASKVDSYGAGDSVGSNFGSGAYYGIDSWIGSIVSKAAEMVRRAKAAANAEQAAQSPSKDMMESGGWFAQGFMIGIMRNTADVVSVASDMVAQAKEPFEGVAGTMSSLMDGIDWDANPVITPVLDLSQVESGMGMFDGLFPQTQILSAARLGRMQPAMALSDTVLGGQSTTNNVNYEINVAASGNGDDIARQVTKAIRAQELMRGRR